MSLSVGPHTILIRSPKDQSQGIRDEELLVQLPFVDLLDERDLEHPADRPRRTRRQRDAHPQGEAAYSCMTDQKE